LFIVSIIDQTVKSVKDTWAVSEKDKVACDSFSINFQKYYSRAKLFKEMYTIFIVNIMFMLRVIFS